MPTYLARVTLVIACVAALVVCSCQALHSPEIEDPCLADRGWLERPKVTLEPTMMGLAHDLDKVEKYIDWYGSVVPKIPDVWGQARLTKHREEFEEQMAAELTTFSVKLNGAVTRADSSYFAQAVALGIAAQPRPRLVRTGSRTVSTEGKSSFSNTIQNVTHSGSRTDSGQQKTELQQPDTPTAPPAIIGKEAPTVDVTKTPVVATALVEGPTTTALISGTHFGKLEEQGIGLEPTEMLEQKARYLNLLNQIRRTNEGDDTADSPGYSLNLIRIPVSILPGKKTEVGYGAEITFTLTPILSDELLPMTFRNLVTNDLVDQVAFPLAKYLESDEGKEDLAQVRHYQLQRLHHDEDFLQWLASGDAPGGLHPDYILPPPVRPPYEELPAPFDELPAPQPVIPGARGARPPAGSSELRQVAASATEQRYTADTAAVRYQIFVKNVRHRLTIPTLAPAKGLEARSPFPNSQIIDVYGIEYAHEVAYQAYQALKKDIQAHGYAHVPDIQSYLQSELNAAYRLLAEPTNQGLWTAFCTPDLVRAIRDRNVALLARMRRDFREHVRVASWSKPGRKFDEPVPEAGEPERMQFSATAGLAWAILVDSALLTDRLVRDMHETAAAKHCPPFCADWPDFYMPCPSPQARAAFNEYVRCRWPIHVFALDPANQEQNLADALATRRETQLALSIAFVNGLINANSLTRYARRLEAQYETVALNRTQVGFSHGENTFGWRFYPRFQTPPTESNFTVLFRDQLIGGPGPNALLRQRRLEPGPRECVAIVMMPSFVPYVTCDSVSNWFGLANPKHKQFDLTEVMRVSRVIRALQTHGPGIQDADCYRGADFPILLRRIEQLDARLPTQIQTVQVPILNTLGGFEMFNNGTTDLAPELYGFYGAPGVDPDKNGTLFLVGDHFSTLRSKVIVGNVECPTKMLSRQVVEVIVPRGQIIPAKGTDSLAGLPVVHAHLATPYGVTREIVIPVVHGEPSKEFYAFEPVAWTFTFSSEPVSTDPTKRLVSLKFGHGTPESVKLQWLGPLADMPKDITITFSFDVAGAKLDAIPIDVSRHGDAAYYDVPVSDIVTPLLKKITDSLKPTANAPRPWAVNPLKSASIKVVPKGQGDKVTPVPISLPIELYAATDSTWAQPPTAPKDGTKAEPPKPEPGKDTGTPAKDQKKDTPIPVEKKPDAKKEENPQPPPVKKPNKTSESTFSPALDLPPPMLIPPPRLPQ